MREMIKGKKLTVFVGEDKELEGKPLYLEIIEILKQCNIIGATVTRGLSGFSQGGKLHTADSEYLMADLPITIEAIDEEEKINTAVEKLSSLPDLSLMEITTITLVAKRPENKESLKES